MRGSLIVIDGADGSGKTVQTERLAKTLAVFGEVRVFDFPRYQSHTGMLVKRALEGEFGDFKSISPFIASLPFVLDRVAARSELRTALSGGHVVCNRYTPSNLAYQAAKIADTGLRDAFIRWLEDFEYRELGLPRPSLVLYLSVSPSLARELLTRQGRTLDQHEADLTYQQSVGDVYCRLASEREDWRVIECAPEGGLLSPEEIEKRVFLVVQDALRITRSS